MSELVAGVTRRSDASGPMSVSASREHGAFTRGLLALARAVNVPGKIHARLLLSKAKHPSLRGHPRMARRLAGWIRFYEYDDDTFFRADDAPAA